MTTSTTPEIPLSPHLPRRLALPDFPQGSLIPYRGRAAQRPDGVIDLAAGTPVDPTPEIARNALFSAANVSGYPTVAGAPVVRAAIAEWTERRRGVAGPGDDEVTPTIGSKESMALLLLHLGVYSGDLVPHPRAAYPTCGVGARLVGATPVPADTDTDPVTWGITEDVPVAVVWSNNPGNSDGHIPSVEQMVRIVAQARTRGAVVISDEYYAESGWEVPWDT